MIVCSDIFTFRRVRLWVQHKLMAEPAVFSRYPPKFPNKFILVLNGVDSRDSNLTNMKWIIYNVGKLLATKQLEHTAPRLHFQQTLLPHMDICSPKESIWIIHSELKWQVLYRWPFTLSHQQKPYIRFRIYYTIPYNPPGSWHKCT